MSHPRTALLLAGVAVSAIAVFSLGAVADVRAGAVPAGFDADAAICRSAEGLGRDEHLLAAAAGLGRLRLAAVSAAEIEDNLDLFEKLGLMEGHLLIGKALLEAGMQKDALPHFGHPASEIYDYLKPVFAERKVPEFEAELQALETLVKEKPKDAATRAAFAEVMKRIEGLRRSIPAALLASPDFVTQGIGLMVQAAADDLAEALDKGRIANTVEYHDAMGFARYAAAAVKSYAPVLGDRVKTIGRDTEYTAAAFPSLKPPAKPAHSVAEVQAAADRVKAIATPAAPKAG